MRLPCKITQDMLPIYYDGVCSEESAELIEQHLKECPQCSKMLIDLETDLKIALKPVDDLQPLKEIQNKWNRCKRTNIQKGICMALVALLLLTAALTCVWYFSYAKHFYQMSKTMVRTTEEDRYLSSSEYTAKIDDLQFDLFMPIILSDCGFARVMNSSGLVLFMYPEAGGNYSFHFIITDESNESWSVHINNDLTANFEDNPFPVRSDTEKSHISQLLSEQQGDIKSMLDAVYVLWNIDLLEYI